MNQPDTFHYRSAEELCGDIARLGLDLPLSNDLAPLFEPVKVGGFTLPNRFVVLPMEGCDGTAQGAPDELTFRRYRRFAGGGAGLLWVEATAVVPEGRANPRQLWLHDGTVDLFAELVDETLRAARQHNGPFHRPLLIVQLTHSGRYSRPGRKPQPIIAHHSPFLDPTHRLPADYPLISDDALERLEDDYVKAAQCAQKAGFDGVDIKACHRYLISELHASYTRENSRYGGSFENRTRFFRNIVQKIRQAVPGLMVTARLNVFDAMARPYGFGVDETDPGKPDLREPKELVRFLQAQGAPLVNLTIGNPYFNPHVNRPFDLPTAGSPLPPEPPLVGVARFVHIVREMQQAFPELAVIGGGYSWLRQFLPQVAAANVQKGWASLVGLGRMAFAYPDCVRELAAQGSFNSEKVCVACSACTQIMRDGGRSGCVPRDPEIYEPIYKEGRSEALDTILQMAQTCRQCNDPTCVTGCPAHVNIPKFVGFITQQKFHEAYDVLREANVLAATCGYVCPSETLCEKGCINQHYTFTVPIRHLQRWIGRKAVEEGWAAQATLEVPATDKRVAVIGAGPAGLAAATKLAEYGHGVTIFERASATGGAAQAVIPHDRLPDRILRGEIEAVLAGQGNRIERRQLELNVACNLDRLFQQGFDAILLAPGLNKAVFLGGPGPRPAGVEGALEFLTQVKQGRRVSGTVLVLGGGNTAIDAAMSAKRAGATDVSIIYRRSFAEMPAWPQERDAAIRAGLFFITLTAPLEYVGDTQGLRGLRVVRTKLGEPDAKGRRTPHPVPGSEHLLPADLVIEAIGQQIEESLAQALNGVRLTPQGLIWTEPDTLKTSRPNVFAAGDAVNGGTTVVQAVAEGMRAARQMDEFLRAESVPIGRLSGKN